MAICGIRRNKIEGIVLEHNEFFASSKGTGPEIRAKNVKEVKAIPWDKFPEGTSFAKTKSWFLSIGMADKFARRSARIATSHRRCPNKECPNNQQYRIKPSPRSSKTKDVQVTI